MILAASLTEFTFSEIIRRPVKLLVLLFLILTLDILFIDIMHLHILYSIYHYVVDTIDIYGHMNGLDIHTVKCESMGLKKE